MVSTLSITALKCKYYSIKALLFNFIHTEIGGGETKQRTTHIVAGVVVIGSLIVGLLLAIYCHRRRNQSEYTESPFTVVAGLM